MLHLPLVVCQFTCNIRMLDRELSEPDQRLLCFFSTLTSVIPARRLAEEYEPDYHERSGNELEGYRNEPLSVAAWIDLDSKLGSMCKRRRFPAYTLLNAIIDPEPYDCANLNSNLKLRKEVRFSSERHRRGTYTANDTTSSRSRGTLRKILRYDKCCAPDPKTTDESTDIENRYVSIACNLDYYSKVKDTACGHQCEATAKSLVEVVKQHDSEEATALDCLWYRY